jgi:hypothetical protein
MDSPGLPPNTSQENDSKKIKEIPEIKIEEEPLSNFDPFREFNELVTTTEIKPMVSTNKMLGFTKWAESRRAKIHPDIPDDFIDAQPNIESADISIEINGQDEISELDQTIEFDAPPPNRYRVKFHSLLLYNFAGL